ncbi:MAG: zf-HC2 domain-containing protein [Prevotella sp.]|nr:zf-HC2 domain-containing protein [Prevotella sp.]MDY4150357.1 zf-HC2 domain-containing protein [Prevotella sp.]
MNCNDFKEKVVDLFDKDIDMQAQAQLREHMANCHDCKAYYDDLRKTFNILQPLDTANIRKTKITHRLWRYAAAVAIFLFGFVIGWNHLFSTPAVADDAKLTFLQQSIQSVQNVGSFQMEVYARTTQQENFATFDPAMPFVKIDIKLLRQNDFLFYRVEKANGRTVVSDGRNQYMWIPNVLYLKGSQESDFLEHFANLIFPERLLTIQKSAIKLSNENKMTQVESDSTIVLTVDGVEKNSDLRQLFETGKMDDCRLIVENTFTKNDGLLRFVKLWVIKDGKKILLLHIDNIRYNVMLNKGEITRLPTAEWTDITEQRATSSNRLKQLQNETPQQAAKRILNAIIADKDSQAAEALIYYKSILPQLIHKLKGCKVSAFETRKDSSYVGVYVFYTLTTPEGNREKRHIAIRNDNEQHIWIVDGGL